MAVPIGTPMMVAMLKPAKTKATNRARLSMGAMIVTKTMINDRIGPATAAVMIRETNIQKSDGARAVSVLPARKTSIRTIRTLNRLNLAVRVVIIGVQNA